MLPRDFIKQFGGCNLLRLHSSIGVPAFVQPDPDRYLICFLPAATGADYFFAPDMDRSEVMPTTLVTAGDQPIAYSHAIQGALVNLGWIVESTVAFPGADIFVIVGTMKLTKPNRGGLTDGKTHSKTRYNFDARSERRRVRG